jgi:hypothetical protein
LGRHEIATIQATAIDKEAGLVRLTTVLAHSSGGVGLLRLARMPDQRYRIGAAGRSCPHVCTALCPFQFGRNCRRRRPRCAGSHCRAQSISAGRATLAFSQARERTNCGSAIDPSTRQTFGDLRKNCPWNTAVGKSS